MVGDRLAIGLGAFYLVLTAVYAYELNWPKALYWLSAFGITSAVLWMK